MPIRITIKCQRCGIEVQNANICQKYCDQCQLIIRREQRIARQHKIHGIVDDFSPPPTAVNEELNKIAKEANRMGMTYGQYVVWKKMKGV